MAMTWAQVRALGLKLAETEESTSYGRPALKVRGKGFCFWNNPEDIVFQLEDVDTQQFLIETQPEVYYITPHYVGWPSVRARLSALSPAECKLRLERAWRIKAPKALLKQNAPATSAKKAPAKQTATKRAKR